MPRWEFHLSMDDVSSATRWVWMYRRENGDSITSKRPFSTYGECIHDALLHGYSAGGLQPAGKTALGTGT